MSTITEVTRTSNTSNTSYDVSKLGLGDNEFITATFTAAATETVPEGKVFGRVSASDKVLICDKDSTDGSQYPVGCLYTGIAGGLAVTSGSTYTITLLVKGKVNGSMVSYSSDTTGNSVVSDIRLKDRLRGIGIIEETVTQLSAVDNA
jgi:hypothetical protein